MAKEWFVEMRKYGEFVTLLLARKKLIGMNRQGKEWVVYNLIVEMQK